jgi:hypothetical protein
MANDRFSRDINYLGISSIDHCMPKDRTFDSNLGFIRDDEIKYWINYDAE